MRGNHQNCVKFSILMCAHRFRCENNNASFMHVQPHYYRVLPLPSIHPHIHQAVGRFIHHLR